jgi:hypothetical protein
MSEQKPFIAILQMLVTKLVAFPVITVIRVGCYNGYMFAKGAEMAWSICLHYVCRFEKVWPFSQQEQETFLLETSHAISVSSAVGNVGVSLEIKRLERETNRPHLLVSSGPTPATFHTHLSCARKHSFLYVLQLCRFHHQFESLRQDGCPNG